MKAAIHSSVGAAGACFMFAHWWACLGNLALALVLAQLDKNKFVISEGGVPYLTRYKVLRTPWFRVLLHNIHKPDYDRDLHNHPWWACCIVIWGGYWQYVQKPSECRNYTAERVRWLNVLSTDLYHRICFVYPNTWTLVVAGPRFRSWGFLVDGDHVDFREYLGLPADYKLED